MELIETGRVNIGHKEPPPEAVAALREIDPGATLIAVDDQWLLGVRGENPGAQAAATQEVAEMMKTPHHRIYGRESALEREEHIMMRGKRLQLLQLFAEGIRPVEMYDMEAWTPAQIVRDFRQADYDYRNRREEAFREREMEADGRAGEARRAETLKDAMRSEASFIQRYVFRGLRHVVQSLKPKKRK